MGTNAKTFEFLLSQVRASGAVLSGGKVHFYVAGTETPKTVWQDRGKTTEAANPYTLDANGTAQVFGDGLYDIVIEDASLTPKYNWTDISIREVAENTYDGANYASLNAAVAAIGSTKATLYYRNDLAVTGNLAIPSNIELAPSDGALINHGAYTISYAGSVSRWPLTRVFNGTGAVTGLPHAYLEWFDTNTTPGGTDMTTAFKEALVAAKTVYLEGTAYKVTDKLDIYGGTAVIGKIPVFGALDPMSAVPGQTTIIFAPTSEKDLFHVQRTAAEIALGNIYTGKVTIANIRMVGNTTGGATTSRRAIFADKAALCTFRDCSMQRFQHGVYNSFTLTNEFSNLYILSMSTACVEYDATTSTTDVWLNCKFSDSPWGVIIQKALSIKFINPLFQSLTSGGVNLYKTCSDIQVIAGYGEDIGGAGMFRVGYDGSSSAEDVNHLTIISGHYGGKNSGGYEGSFFDVDSAFSVKIQNAHATRWVNLVRATSNTHDKGINWDNVSFTSCTNTFVATTGKITGFYYVADLDTGNYRRIYADRGYFDGPVQSVGITTTLSIYADNAAALAGGLTAGMMYRTAVGDVMIVY